MDFGHINILAVCVAAASSFVLGGLWYSPLLFGKAWMEGCGLTELDVQQANMKVTFAGAIVLTLIATVFFALVLGPKPVLGEAVLTGLVIGLTWVSAAMGISYLFEQRPLKLFLINAGYHICQFLLIGLVLGLLS
ncbi:DUF1761 domain-containing protein [Pseudoalteromonas fenneropenaei]|uniref:DUF1761 domain-containing protein n=1 Tax=Pseudoalteromonas fenneropenaei TaxID=1737459 RepID=A0ABV7CQF1_9GAMM